MCEGEVATVSSAVRLAYDVLGGRLRALCRKLTLGWTLKPVTQKMKLSCHLKYYSNPSEYFSWIIDTDFNITVTIIMRRKWE